MVCTTPSRRWYRQPDTGFELFTACNYCPTTANAVIYYELIVANNIVLCHQMHPHLIDDFVILKLKLFRQHTGSAGSFFTLKQYKKCRFISEPAYCFFTAAAYFSSAAFSLSASTASRAALSAKDMLPSTRPSSSSLMVRLSRSINI